MSTTLIATPRVDAPALGPCTIATLVHASAKALVTAYCDYLACEVLANSTVTSKEAALWQAPSSEGASYWLLGNTLGQAWLRIIQQNDAQPARAAAQSGWVAMEILVENADTAARQLVGSPFEVLRPPANLAMSDNIRASQAMGPAGELLYLTEIKNAVPPFDLPRARCAVDHLFIPVLCTPDRNASLALYEELAAAKGLSFDTKVTVINHLRGYPIDRQHPLATVQLAGSTLIEIDELSNLSKPENSSEQMPGGIAMVTFLVDRLPEHPLLVHAAQRLDNAPYCGCRAAVLIGNAGERIELIEKTPID